jgi:hypothetical protein
MPTIPFPGPPIPAGAGCAAGRGSDARIDECSVFDYGKLQDKYTISFLKSSANRGRAVDGANHVVIG